MSTPATCGVTCTAGAEKDDRRIIILMRNHSCQPHTTTEFGVFLFILHDLQVNKVNKNGLPSTTGVILVNFSDSRMTGCAIGSRRTPIFFVRVQCAAVYGVYVIVGYWIRQSMHDRTHTLFITWRQCSNFVQLMYMYLSFGESWYKLYLVLYCSYSADSDFV